ncbi:hypothetical protein N7453_009531 [Penicillium expansum]|nr:hypothetical protein N7453_009531 [Penicillium expansum]
MQRVIQRTASARKQALKKTNKAHERQELLERVGIRRARKDFGGALSSQFQTARKNRWEDWEKGPLAPMRDSGLQRTTYGGQDASILHPPRLLSTNNGGMSSSPKVNRDSETVLIKGINMADVIIPEWAKDRMGHTGDTQPQSFPVSFDDIRHVIPLEDTKTGKMQNVIVQHAYAAGPYTERSEHSKLPRFTRYVSGLDVEIPWPLEEEPVITDGEMDTTRMAVEASTFTPTLEQPPMPSTVIDELRNKYSRFRTRHDPEYLKEKMKEDYRKEYRKTVSMMTPKTDAKNLKIAQLAEARKANLDANGNGILTPDAINFINNHIQTERLQKSKTKKSKSKQAA